MENSIITIEKVKEFGIEESKALQIKQTFEKMSDGLLLFEEKFNQIILKSKSGINEMLCSEAKRLRLDISKVRIETEKLRKSQKEEYLRAGKAIDGVANILKWAVESKENDLSEIEKYFENLEKLRLEKLQAERLLQIETYLENASEINFSCMDEDVWQAYFQTKKKNYEDKIELEIKQKTFDERKSEIAPYSNFTPCNKLKLTIDTTEVEYGAILGSLISKKEQHEFEQKKIRLENERLKKELF